MDLARMLEKPGRPLKLEVVVIPVADVDLEEVLR
jgi:hypothetical protein